VEGVILNRASAGYAPTLKATVEEQTGVPVLGYVPQLDDVRLERRHLGLVAADEVPELCEKIDALADALTKTLDLDALLALARMAEPLEVEACDGAGLSHPAVCRSGEREPHDRACHSEPKKSEAIDGADDFGRAHPTIAVARDEAFSFYYDETLDLLERLGARLAFFSPLHDSSLPTDACGLYVGGGYPELHARELSENTAMVKAVRTAIEGGMPTIAECGGFLYLHEELEDAEGTYWPLVGVVPGRAYKTDRLRRFGYVTLTARRDGLLAQVGERLRAHEFHYWESDDPGDAFHAQKPQSARSWDCVISTPTLYAGFPHLYLAGQPEVARRFVEACVAYGTGSRQQVRGEGVS
jgi:cobyrinic acid a,c-diamide synthase